MGEPGGDLDLLEKPIRPDCRREVGPEHLDGYRPIVLCVFGKVDRGHPPATDFADECVAVFETGDQTGRDVVHGPKKVTRGRGLAIGDWRSAIGDVRFG